MSTDAQREHFEAVVIGAGQGGVPLARALAEAGLRTALVEARHVGGTCINEGCTPTKTMVASARVAYLARRAADYGVVTGPVAVDMRRVRDRKRAIVESFRTGSERRLEATPGLTLVPGAARFTGPRTLAVRIEDGSTRRLEADRIFINTGARPAQPAVEGIERVPALDSTTVMELDTLPRRLLVLGGGYIGLEFGQMFRRYGSEVTIVQRGGALLPREDADVSDAVRRVLEEDGVEVLCDTAAARVEPVEGDGVRLTLRTPAGARTIDGSHLLVAAGRVPNTERLGLEAAGVATDRRGFVSVNARLETTAPGVWAMGDVKGGPAFTHISYDDFRILRTNLLEGGAATTAERLLPYTVFTDPQLGRVGLTEREARATGRDVAVATMPMGHVARALEMDEPRGFMKVVVDRASGAILGAAVLGIEGGELMAVVQMAMMGRVPYTALRDAVFAHPTLAESLNNLFAAPLA
jgi:pyruvate/2-oxoglutarate dehydrogenase complex dihydrolipoamide dehydrogenase (E3) component